MPVRVHLYTSCIKSTVLLNLTNAACLAWALYWALASSKRSRASAARVMNNGRINNCSSSTPLGRVGVRNGVLQFHMKARLRVNFYAWTTGIHYILFFTSQIIHLLYWKIHILTFKDWIWNGNYMLISIPVLGDGSPISVPLMVLACLTEGSFAYCHYYIKGIGW